MNSHFFVKSTFAEVKKIMKGQVSSVFYFET